MAPKYSLEVPTPLRIHFTPLTPEGFSRFGHIIQNPSAYISSISNSNNSQAAIVNQGTARKYQRIVPLSTSYPLTSPKATPNINFFVCSPPRLVGPNSNLFPVHILERHPFTTQTFIPLGLSPSFTNLTKSKYLVIVAPSLPTPGNLPDLQNLKAFIAYGNQGVTYGAKTWHAPMVALGEKDIEFVVINYENGITEEDLEECAIAGDGKNSGADLGGIVVEVRNDSDRLWNRERVTDMKGSEFKKARL